MTDTTYRHSTRDGSTVEYSKKQKSTYGKHFTNVRVATDAEVKELQGDQ
jgi:hypothetical protein